MIYRVETRATPTGSWVEAIRTPDKQAAHDCVDRAVTGRLQAHAARVMVGRCAIYTVTAQTKTEAGT